MPDIYSQGINSDSIVGGPGRLVVRDYDGTFPETIGEVMSTSSPYALQQGWSDLGATNDGIATTRTFETEEFEVDQVIGAVDTDITGWEHSLETNLAENTIENRQLALVGGTIVETSAQLGTSTTLTGDVAINATIITVTDAAEMSSGSFLQISEGGNTQTIQINRVEGNTVYLEEPLQNAYTSTTATVSPVTELGTKRIGYGTTSNIPFKTYALLSQKKDGTLYMAVIRKAKIAPEDKEQTYSKEKRLLPLQLMAFPEDGVIQEENVYYEIEQIK